jgi:hypothetical protein
MGMFWAASLFDPAGFAGDRLNPELVQHCRFANAGFTREDDDLLPTRQNPCEAVL